MRCEFCGEHIDGNPIKQNGEFFCSVECANMASEIEDDDDAYFEDADEGEYDEDDLDLEVYDYEE